MSGRKQLETKDVMILVLGATGSGKSSLINTILGEEKMKVDSGLASCTAELGFGYLGEIKGYPSLKDRIVLVDTPGFNDRCVEDFEILEKISTWLRDVHKKGSKLGGVLYLYDITANRFDNAAQQNLKIIQRLLGDAPLHNVVLTTTKWGLNFPNSEDFHTELITNYWTPLINKGARVRRFDTGHESAWNIIEILFTQIAEGNFQPVDPRPIPVARNPARRILKAFHPFIGLFRKGGQSAM